MFEVGRGALCRTTRDEDGAGVEVCSRCGSRESVYGYNPAAQPPLTEWPLSIEQLVEEEWVLLTRLQKSKMAVMKITPDDAKRWLDEPEEGDAT
jgi:hypothetical protein